MRVRAHRQARQQLEEFLAAPCLVVQGNQQTVRRPRAAAAPRRERGRFVERGAQAIARGDDSLDGNGRTLRPRLELPDLIEQIFAQPLRREVRAGADRHQQVEQRVGGGDERIVGT